MAGARNDFRLDFNPEGVPRAGYSRRGRHRGCLSRAVFGILGDICG